MTPMAIDEGLRAAFDKAVAREPIHRVAVGFVPAGSRPAFMAWVALLAELRECAFELSDARVTTVKAGWWTEELDGVARGAARHPLTRALVRHGGPWHGVGTALLEVAGDDAPAADLEAAIAALRPLADALAAVERALFGGAASDAAARALAIHWLRGRLEHGLDAADRGRVPLALFARHGLRRDQLASAEAESLRRDWARALCDALPVPVPKRWAYPRLLACHVDRNALRLASSGRAVKGRAAPRFSDLWLAWRCARNAALQGHGPANPDT